MTDTQRSPTTLFSTGIASRIVPTDVEARRPEYWSWIAVVLFLLLAVDLLTTTVAVQQFGLAAEGNPVMQWLLAQGPGVVLAAHLAVVVLVAAFCYGAIETIAVAETPTRGRLALVFEVWIGLLVSAGLFLFANNLSAIVLRASLF